MSWVSEGKVPCKSRDQTKNVQVSEQILQHETPGQCKSEKAERTVREGSKGGKPSCHINGYMA